MQHRSLLWIVPLIFLGSGALSPARADSGFLKGLSLTAAKGTNPNEVNFTVTETTLPNVQLLS